MKVMKSNETNENFIVFLYLLLSLLHQKINTAYDKKMCGHFYHSRLPNMKDDEQEKCMHQDSLGVFKWLQFV